MNFGLSPTLVACIALVALAGCGAAPPVKSFLGASYPKVTYKEIQPRSALAARKLPPLSGCLRHHGWLCFRHGTSGNRRGGSRGLCDNGWRCGRRPPQAGCFLDAYFS